MSGTKITAKVTVLGLGNCGVKVISQLCSLPEASWLNLVALDTDSSSLDNCPLETKIYANSEWLKGQGCGGDVMKGERALSRERKNLSELLKDSSLLIVTGGFGGGTATGGAPIVASVAKSLSIPTIFIVSMPFILEGHTKIKLAEDGLHELLPKVDALMAIPNDLLFLSLPSETPLEEAFAKADMEMARALLGVAGIVRCGNLVATDMATLRSIFHQQKTASAIGVGAASLEADGENRCHVALERLMASPLLGGAAHLAKADVLVITVTGGPDLQIGELKRSLEALQQYCPKEARIIVGMNTDPASKGFVQLTAVAVEIEGPPPEQAHPLTPQVQGANLPAGKARAAKGRHSAGNADPAEQPELPGLRAVSKGIFHNTTASRYRGIDLDIPSYDREGITVDKGN
ncbi:MAG: hypothetical protein A2X49_14810 [Lentisphaerae bacterium GWF2_52_8]|nr:MAG: hypothetical protein A2X49_14810 [Lentisphaerae bacterium GWF2_52_8]